MHYSTKRRVVLGMTTGGLLMTGIGMADAQTGATAAGDSANSPGVASGNTVQLPINAPINVCGNQLDVIGILDSVSGNSCSNKGSGGASAEGSANGSPGVGSGNLIQVPINTPINICGNQLDVIGIGDSVHGNSCSNEGGGSSTAEGSAKGSPGVGSGNLIQVPINAPVNVCGNQVDVIGILNSVTGNSCGNGGHGGKPTPTPTPPVTTPPGQPSSPPSTCSCPPPPPPTTPPCPPSGTATPTATTTSSVPPSGSPSGSPSGGPSGGPSGTPSTSPSGSPSTSTSGGPSETASPTSTSGHGGGHHNGSGSNNGIGGGTSGGGSGVLAHTGSGAMMMAPLGAGLIGGGLYMRKRFPARMH
jgi:hypothetical protein